jgi:acyl-[acyl-carrier-protein]-phospholipid O-acyltransferase/long-chain-fatty-acid--[acyl-carrier-protein] ligase
MFAELLRSRRFAPLFWCQFFSAFNDNYVRNMLAMLVLFKLGQDSAGPLISLAIGLFMLPTLLLSGLAGQLADSRDKALTAQRLKLFEIGVQMVAAAGFLFSSTVLLYVALAGLGTVAALFSPIKYGILPDHLKTRELPAGNALIEAATFIAIVLGIVVGSLAATHDTSPWSVVAQLMIIALIGYGSSRFIPGTGAADPGLRINPNIFASTVGLLRSLFHERRLWVGGLATSWFWMVGAVALSLVPLVIKNRIGGDIVIEMAVNGLFAVGIAIGSVLAAVIAHGRIMLLPVPVAGLLMSALLIDLGRTAGALSTAVGGVDILTFAHSRIGIHIALDVVGLAVSGGLFIVPVFAAVQAWAGEERRARVIAAVNVLNALFMVAGTVVTAVLQMKFIGASEPMLLVGLGILTVGASIYLFRNLPGNFARELLQLLFRVCFRLEVRGREHVAEAGDRCVIAVNHLSLIDAAVVFTAIEDRAAFAIDTATAQKWWARPFVRYINAFHMDPTRPMSTRRAIEHVRAGNPLVIFPEGRVTVTGALMKVYDGAGMIADKSQALVVPVRLDGLEQTPFSYLKPGQIRRRWFPKVRVTFLPPQRLAIDPALVGKARRLAAGAALYDVMSDLVFETTDFNTTIIEAVGEAAHRYGMSRVLLEDPLTGKLSARKALMGAAALGRKIMAFTDLGENVGLMLPNANGAAVTFMALQAAGRVPAMMNYTAGSKNLLAACKAARIRSVLTSRAFVEKAKLQPVVQALSEAVAIHWLEDIRPTIGTLDKLRALFAAGRPLAARAADDAAAVVFTSGSEGVPKGVVLSHRNILSNCAQVRARTDLGASDIMFNPLPVFHSFGMTGGMVLPLVSGMKLFLYPSPLHYRLIPELVYQTNATVLLGTDTFLNGYARTANEYDFRSLRYICAGAEPVKAETRRVYMERFGHKIYEGYGVTEAGPVLAVNTPMFSRNGTVGRLMPGVEYRLEEVPGIENAGRLHVRGPNILTGYYRIENPGVVDRPPGGWHDTGDICAFDPLKFITIKGRAKRFAKIGGEMISLAAVEQICADLWPDHPPVVAAAPDAKKGERLIMLTTKPGAQRGEVAAHMRAKGATELMMPADLMVVDALPLLGSGKPDHVEINRLVRDRLGLGKAA